MKKDQNNPRNEGYSSDWSDQNFSEGYNVLDPSPGNDYQFLDDDDDELSDYSRMENASDLDTEE